MGGRVDGRAYEAAGELLRALAAPVRIGIVTELSDGDRCVHELVDALGVAQPLVSQHLKVLRDAGVVRGRRRGREIAYALVDDRVAHLVADAVSHARTLQRPDDEFGAGEVAACAAPAVGPAPAAVPGDGNGTVVGAGGDR